jgi:hypothetical protein
VTQKENPRCQYSEFHEVAQQWELREETATVSVSQSAIGKGRSTIKQLFRSSDAFPDVRSSSGFGNSQKVSYDLAHNLVP